VGIRRFAFDHVKWPLRHADSLARLSNLPGIRQAGRKLLFADGTNLSYIPINEGLNVPPGVVAPTGIVEHFIREACHHVIIRRCPCRSANGCREYDPGFGCTFLGSGARQVDEGIARHVTMEESLAHFREATRLGLVTAIGSFKADAIALGVKDSGRLMTVCHCCPCCCVSTGLHLAEPRARGVMVKLEGVEVEVGDGCTACGACVEACIFRQMRLDGDRAVVGPECKGCGRCASACRQGVITISIDNPAYVEECIARIGSAVDVT